MPQAPVGGTYSATVVIVDPVIDAASGTFAVRIKLPNKDHRLPAGLKCLVSSAEKKKSPMATRTN